MSDPFLDRSAAGRRDFFEKQGELLQRLAEQGQSPEALFVGCSDSRVVPEQLLGARPGQLFMLRNIANTIPPYWQTEISVVAVLEFALFELRVPHAIICGHTDCGGVLGLERQIDITRQPGLARWLDLVRPAQREVDFYQSDLSPAERHRAIVERNVILQLRNLQSYPFVRQALEANRLELHGWVYYLKEKQIGTYDLAADRFVIGLPTPDNF